MNAFVNMAHIVGYDTLSASQGKVRHYDNGNLKGNEYNAKITRYLSSNRYI